MAQTFTAALLAVTLLTTSCASIVSKSTYPVSINSSVKGQAFTVYQDGVEVTSGKTPDQVTLKASKGYFQPASYNVAFEGEKTKNIPLAAEIDPWYIANILLGGVIGMLIVDPLTGAMWKLPETVGMRISRDTDADEGKTSSLNGAQTKVISMHDVPESYRAQLVPASF